MGSARSSPSATTPGGREPSRRSWLAPCPPRWSRRRPRRPTTGHTWRRDVLGWSRASWAAGGPVAEPGPPAASSSVARASPRVAIVVLHFDQREALTACLESCRRIAYRDYEVIVVENGSPAEPSGLLATGFGADVRVLRSPVNLGYAKGNNLGIPEACRRGGGSRPPLPASTRGEPGSPRGP